MRKQLREILKAYFYTQLIATRSEKRLTQSQMAERLAMEDRSYIDLDQGKTCCSAITLARFLIFVCESLMQFLEGLRRAFEEAEKRWHNLSETIDLVSYRRPLPITEVVVLKSGSCYPRCPRCRLSIDREYMNYCDRCGQRLEWREFALGKVCEVVL